MADYKVTIVGPLRTGKSTVLFRLIQNRFVDEIDPAIEDVSFRKQLQVDGEGSGLEILDSPGHEEFTAVRDAYIGMAEGILCVYSITSRSSFEDIDGLRQAILRIKGKNEGEVPMVLLGNKCDLESERQVSKSEGEDYAASHGCPFFEASAKDNTNVEEAFCELVRQIRQKPPVNPPRTRSGERGCCSLM